MKTAKAAEDEATMRLSAALQALKLVTVLDRQEESGALRWWPGWAARLCRTSCPTRS